MSESTWKAPLQELGRRSDKTQLLRRGRRQSWYRRLEALFDAAIDVPSGQRRAFIDRECVEDSALRNAIEELISADGSSTGKLTQRLGGMQRGAGLMFTHEAGSNHAADFSPERNSIGADSVIGKYQIIHQLGHGGMGKVYLARDLELGRLAALKVLGKQGPDLSARFVAEAQTTARCSHENIVVIYEAGQHKGRPYMALEYIKGQTLREWMNQHSQAHNPARMGARVPTCRAIELMIPVVRALVCAHRMGIVHRDLKPENVMLTESGTIKVVDFGIAKLLLDQMDNGPGDAETLAPPTASNVRADREGTTRLKFRQLLRRNPSTR